jgi:hypothetical protein
LPVFSTASPAFSLCGLPRFTSLLRFINDPPAPYCWLHPSRLSTGIVCDTGGLPEAIFSQQS